MDTHNICLYKEVDKNYTGCNLKTTELLDCAVIRSNMVYLRPSYKEVPEYLLLRKIVYI